MSIETDAENDPAPDPEQSVTSVLMAVNGSEPAVESRSTKRNCSVNSRRVKACNGAGNRARTDDLLITNQLLYQLSYAGVLFKTPFGRSG